MLLFDQDSLVYGHLFWSVHLVELYVFELFVRETNLKKKRSVKMYLYLLESIQLSCFTSLVIARNSCFMPFITKKNVQS